MGRLVEREVPAEERQDVVLKAVGHGAGMRAAVEFEAVPDSVKVEEPMQFGGIRAQAVLVPDIDRDGMVLAQVEDVLIQHRERRVRRPAGEHVRLHHAVLGRQVEVQRRILGIG